MVLMEVVGVGLGIGWWGGGGGKEGFADVVLEGVSGFNKRLGEGVLPGNVGCGTCRWGSYVSWWVFELGIRFGIAETHPAT